MNKSVEALLRGYILFDVNGKKFVNYNNARTHRVYLTDTEDLPYVEFVGYHITKGWQCFYLRTSNIELEKGTYNDT